MRILHYFNLIFYTLTVAVYFIYMEMIAGMMIQFWLGLFHLFTALILITEINKNHFIRKHLNYYWIIVITYLLYFFIVANDSINNEITQIITLSFIPMLIGLYLSYIIYQLQKKVNYETIT